jgi:uncharacterized protein
LKNRWLDVHMRSLERAAASARSPLPILHDRCTVTTSIDRRIAQELGVREEQVAATVALLDGGATVPFIARYRALTTRSWHLDERVALLRVGGAAQRHSNDPQQGKLTIRSKPRSVPQTARSAGRHLPFAEAPQPSRDRREAGLEPLVICRWRTGERPAGRAARFVDAESRSPMRRRTGCPRHSGRALSPRTPT